MHIEEEYYINLYVVGKFVRDLHVRCSGGEMVRFKEDPDTISYFELCKIVKKRLGFNTVQLIYFHVPSKHEIDTAIFADDDLMLLVATVECAGDGNEGVEIAGSKGGEGVEGLNGEGVDVAGSKGGEGVELVRRGLRMKVIVIQKMRMFI
ncbi:hypothetical protein Golax_005517 [Gossypium laxum]|uniref:PB1-like domain-containing protein n=1 Tax=Gossypium laxum TaxID=34288 RepID=A0A7J9A1D2_9ROSI|nr:hypothetical protein [Gossypium laxum]